MTVVVCGRFVSWWAGEYEGNCELPDGHDGDHWDGLSWFDDDLECTDDKHWDGQRFTVTGPDLAQLLEPTPENLRGVPTRPKYSQLSLPGTPARPRRHGSTVRAHCTSCGRFAANPKRDTDTGFCIVHGACHLTWG